MHIHNWHHEYQAEILWMFLLYVYLSGTNCASRICNCMYVKPDLASSVSESFQSQLRCDLLYSLLSAFVALSSTHNSIRGFCISNLLNTDIHAHYKIAHISNNYYLFFILIMLFVVCQWQLHIWVNHVTLQIIAEEFEQIT